VLLAEIHTHKKGFGRNIPIFFKKIIWAYVSKLTSDNRSMEAIIPPTTTTQSARIGFFLYQSIPVLNVKEDVQRPRQQVHHTRVQDEKKVT